MHLVENIPVEQPCWMGVAATPRYKEYAYSVFHSEKKMLEISDSQFLNYCALYIGYNLTNASYNALKVAAWAGLCL